MLDNMMEKSLHTLILITARYPELSLMISVIYFNKLLKGKWAVKVTGNWRGIFSFKEGNAYEVDYIDYH